MLHEPTRSGDAASRLAALGLALAAAAVLLTFVVAVFFQSIGWLPVDRVELGDAPSFDTRAPGFGPDDSELPSSPLTSSYLVPGQPVW